MQSNFKPSGKIAAPRVEKRDSPGQEGQAWPGIALEDDISWAKRVVIVVVVLIVITVLTALQYL